MTRTLLLAAWTLALHVSAAAQTNWRRALAPQNVRTAAFAFDPVSGHGILVGGHERTNDPLITALRDGEWIWTGTSWTQLEGIRSPRPPSRAFQELLVDRIPR